jgi:Lon protease-like protein
MVYKLLICNIVITSKVYLSMSIQKLLYENKDYNIIQIEKDIDYQIPDLIHTAYFDNMVIMPKCKCHVIITEQDIPSVKHIIDTNSYIALIREDYRSSIVKQGCIARILDYEMNDVQSIKLHIEGIKRFLSYEDTTIFSYPYEVIKPDFNHFDKDSIKIPIPIDFSEIDPILIQFFLQFISDLSGNDTNKVDFGSLSLDKFLNSLIMIMPITDIERFYLSEIPSLMQREEALSLILNCTFNSLTHTYKYH